jgi:undecaprenyl-diphosphatase
MDILKALVLGVVQGATEFLPISSSGHLVLAQLLLGTQDAGLPFDVALHMGTLVAILVYFRNDFLAMALGLLGKKTTPANSPNMRTIFLLICLATIPGVAAGLVLGDLVETSFRNPLLVATTLSGAGLLLLWADKNARRSRKFQDITLRDALLIGIAQALAIVPGISRSGITMTAGLLCDLNREAVVRFSFLLSAPIIFGAGIYKIPSIISQGLLGANLPFYLTGFTAAAASGYFVIAFLMHFVRTKSFAIFAYYRFLLSAVVVAVFLLR